MQEEPGPEFRFVEEVLIPGNASRLRRADFFFLLLFCSSLLPLPVTFGMFFFPAFGIVLCVLFETVRLLFAVLTLAYILPVWLCNIKRKNECVQKKKERKEKPTVKGKTV